jgi:predicted DNA-binding protein
MTTKNPRINVTFEESTIVILSNLAEHEDKPIAKLVRELALEALEIREDLYLSKVAEKLDKKGAKTYNHNEAWK